MISTDNQRSDCKTVPIIMSYKMRKLLMCYTCLFNLRARY